VHLVRNVLRQVLGEGLRVVAIGVVAGVLLALAGGRLIAALLYGIAPTDPTAMTVAATVLLVTATVASLAPAWRAAKADPVTALRSE